MRPERLALGAAMGSFAASSSARAIGCVGARSAIVSRPALTRSAIAQPACRGSTSDSGPGQKASHQFPRSGVDDGVALGLLEPKHMHDQRIEARALLGGEHLGDRRGVERIGAEPVHRLGWKGDDIAARQGFRGAV